MSICVMLMRQCVVGANPAHTDVHIHIHTYSRWQYNVNVPFRFCSLNISNSFVYSIWWVVRFVLWSALERLQIETIPWATERLDNGEMAHAFIEVWNGCNNGLNKHHHCIRSLSHMITLFFNQSHTPQVLLPFCTTTNHRVYFVYTSVCDVTTFVTI